MKRELILAAAAAAVLGSAPVLAGDIYRYTDADGNVHYVDRPTGASDEERLAISSRPTNPQQVQARAATRYGDRGAETGDAGGADADDEPATRAERAAAAKERAQQCQKYRDQLETYVTSRRLYRETADGEREYLDDTEVQEARSKTEELIVEHCD